MITLLIATTLGVIFAIFGTQNTGLVTVNFSKYAITLPVYQAILIPVVVVLVLAFFLHWVRDLSQKLTINEQKDQIDELKKEIAETTKEAHKYQLESTKLKSENGELDDEDSI